MLTSLLLKLTYLGAEWILWLLVALSVLSIALDPRALVLLLADGRRRRRAGWPSCRSELRKGNLPGGVATGERVAHLLRSNVAWWRRGWSACATASTPASEAMLSAKARMRPALDANLSILRARGRDPGSPVRGQGSRLRDADLRLPRPARGDGGLAALARRGAAHADLPRPPARLRGGARHARRDRRRKARRARRGDRSPGAPASAPAPRGPRRNRRREGSRSAACDRVRARRAGRASLRRRAPPRRDRC